MSLALAGRGCILRYLLVLVVLTAFNGSAARAQRPESVDKAERDQMFEELARELKELQRQATLLRRVVKLVTPSVVHIEAKADNKPVEEAGGGIVIKLGDKYYVLTNRHVIKYSSLQRISIRLEDGRVIRPDNVWSDPGTDVAVMKISAERLLPARIGDSQKMDIGDYVLAVGSPFGLSHSVTFGIISAKGRRDLQLGDDRVRFQDFLQTDAAINPGNSGGPLINLRGEVIGINTAIASSSGGSEGIGFTIPSNMAMLIARQLIELGRVSRAYLGVHLDREFDPAQASRSLGLARPVGARVSGITPKSPAERARIRVDDVIVKVNGQWIDDDDHLINLVSLTPIGKEVELTLVRERRPLRIKVKVGERARFEPE